MRRFFTTILVALAATTLMAQMQIWYNGSIVYQREYALIDSITFGLPSSPGGVGSALSPEDTKEKLMAIARKMVNQFNTADQKEAIDLADQLFVKYKEYSWEEVGSHFEDRYEPIFNMPHYIKAVAKGQQNATSTDVLLSIGFNDESAIFEADDAARSWKYKGKSSDNSIILRCKDANGNTIEAKAWGVGKTSDYEYTWEKYEWIYPKVYVNNPNFYQCCGQYNGQYKCFYYNEYSGEWYYWDDERGESVTVSLADIDVEYAYGTITTADGSTTYNFKLDQSKGMWYYMDWNNGSREYAGKRTIHVAAPQEVHFTLKKGSSVLSQLDFTQEMVRNDHAYFTLEAKLANLSWSTDVKINSTYATAAFDFSYGEKKFFSGAANLPVYKLIDIEAGQSYEDWIKQYEERYDELLKAIGEADAIVDLFGELQIKAKVKNFGYAYRDYRDWDKKYNGYFGSRESVEQYCNIFMENSENGLYFNSDVKQAELRMQPSYDERYGNYEPEAVLYFPQDGTSYAFEEYFNCRPFTSELKYMVEDLINMYIHASPTLYGEVGEISL